MGPIDVSADRPIMIGAAIGSGIAAVTAERGGADFLLAVNAGRMRNRGAASIASMLPCHDPQSLTEDFLAKEVLPSVRIPVLLGASCWGARSCAENLVDRLRKLGAAGAVNFPNATLMSAGMRMLLDQAGRGAAHEIAMLRAVQDAGLSSLYYCGTREQARMAAEAGLDMILLNFGWNVGGVAGHERRASLEEVGLVTHEYARLIRSIHPRARILLEGGPIITADDLGYVTRFSAIDGYVGGSTLDRLPYEESVINRIAGYRQAVNDVGGLDEKQDRVLAWGRRNGFVGRSRALLAYLAALRRLSASTHPLALFHEEGTELGPSLSALAGRPRPVVHVDPAEAAFPGQVAQQLFGRAAGDAGLLVGSQSPLLVLRGIERLLPSVQRRLARTLREGSVTPRGARRPMPVTARCVFVFKRSEALETFPEDLAEELAALLVGWSVSLPPLRDRVEDLSEHIVRIYERAGVAGRGMTKLSPAAMQTFRRHPWSRNEAELEEIVGRLLSTGPSAPLSHEDAERLLRSAAHAEAAPAARELERARIVDALWRNGFHRSRAAASLNISRKTLYNKMRKLGLSD